MELAMLQRRQQRIYLGCTRIRSLTTDVPGRLEGLNECLSQDVHFAASFIHQQYLAADKFTKVFHMYGAYCNLQEGPEKFEQFTQTLHF
jgi:hypothetical protein